MTILSRRSLLAALAMWLPSLARAQAQGLSDRNIFIIVPFTPGSGPDVLARIVGEELRKRWNQPVIIDNKPGASGNIGAAAAARTEPDGHTILLSVNTFLMNAALSKSLLLRSCEELRADRRTRHGFACSGSSSLGPGEEHTGTD